jgi:hypothetical protein
MTALMTSDNIADSPEESQLLVLKPRIPQDTT